ncbi:fam-h protein [Plasmodium relictum]|uniref:Fam-h protein n=1 Tax=Plasmodium relictum TaxID=85471 RepID=A0A1J1GKD8_PLARL|nr:fam-h protein [Plasmodium relictum]CRG84963.1 fam-h protein [Plasmodium relictum]
MNKKNNIILISNYRKRPIYCSHVAKSFTTTDMSTSKIYTKREKKNVLYFFIKFFVFTLSIWILQCFNNWDSCKFWNYKNDLNILDLVSKRSLAENYDTIKQTKSKLGLGEQGTIEAHLETKNEQSGIKQNIDVEKGNEVVTKDRNNKVKCNKKILSKCRSNIKLISSSFAFFLSFFLFILSIIGQFTFIPFTNYFFLLLPLSLVINSIILTHERTEIKYKNKF